MIMMMMMMMMMIMMIMMIVNDNDDDNDDDEGLWVVNLSLFGRTILYSEACTTSIPDFINMAVTSAE